MASNFETPQEAIGLHNKMVLNVSNYIFGESLATVKELFRYNPLTPRDLWDIENIQHLFNHLMRYKKIDYGKYHHFTSAIKEAFPSVHKMIQKYADEINNLMDDPDDQGRYAVNAKMRDLICRGNVSKLKTRINDGLDLSTWRDLNGNNIYHYCVYFDVTFEILCVAEAVPKLCHTHASLLQERGYQSTPVLQACKMSVDANKYNLAVLEFFLRHVQDINYETLLRSSGNPLIHKFLTWRQKYPAGLPKELARLQNQYILSFIEAIEEMDISTAHQYMTSIQEQAELSRNIRIVILGYQGVGKTTLLLRLTGQDLASLKPTDQIDIHQNLVIVDQDLNKYWLIPKELEHDVARSRLQNILTDSMTSHQRKANIVNRSEEAEVMNISVEPSKADHDVEKEVIYERDMTLSRSQDVLTDDSASVEKDSETALKSEAGAAMLATNMTSLGSAESKAYVSIFDFGGEIMFSNFQHIFLNTNNVVLLCFSLHKVFEEDKILGSLLN